MVRVGQRQWQGGARRQQRAPAGVLAVDPLRRDQARQAVVTMPLNYAAIIYFETGIFGGVTAAGDGVTYPWRVGAVTPFSTPQ